jgi:3-oxoacyl-[acyl-carrier protein] reductase
MLKDKVALITGGANGIGQATAIKFLENGATVIIIDNNRDKLIEFVDTCDSEYISRIFTYCGDVSDQNRLKFIFNDIKDINLSIDILVNNAGIMQDATLQTVTSELIKNIYDVNVFGTIYVTQLAMKSMIKKRKGSIINLSSIIGTNGNSGQTVYSSSKSAIIGFTKSLSKELAPLNIRVNAVAPGFIDTDMTKNIDSKYHDKNVNSIGMKRIGTAEDVAKVILFLASDMSEYVTGQVIGVDGGMII